MERDERARPQRGGLDSYGAVILLLCAALACLTALQCRVWQSNVTLWTHAVAVSPRLARPALNLGVAYRQSGHLEQAARWYLIAGPLTVHDPRAPEYALMLARELGLLETLGTFVCDHDTARPYC